MTELFKPMTAAEFRQIAEDKFAGYSGWSTDRGIAAIADWAGIAQRTAQRYARGREIPPPTAKLLRTLANRDYDPRQMELDTNKPYRRTAKPRNHGGN